ncbi:MAG: DUF4093 domain-containing protein [Oscillospiraceae bacterium]|nr:DUF4093 domain-containing protein [Candidatus Limimonas coprohippi]
MIHTDKVVVVEGKYDAIKLDGILDATVITTDGFQIFKDKEKQNLLMTLATKRGLIVLTDSDSAGFMIRNFLGSRIPQEYITNVYIPDIYGKEKRKDKPSAEGTLGVEGMPVEVLEEAFKKAGVLGEKPKTLERQITRLDFYEDGLMGGVGSKEKREKLLLKLELPKRLSTTSLLKIINILITYDEYKELLK